MNRIFQSKINVFLSFSYIIGGLALMHQAIGATKRGHARDVAENASKLVVVPPSVHGLDAFSNRVRRGGICRHPSWRTWSLCEPQTADCVWDCRIRPIFGRIAKTARLARAIGTKTLPDRRSQRRCESGPINMGRPAS
jgi:hypothetical protein